MNVCLVRFRGWLLLAGLFLFAVLPGPRMHAQQSADPAQRWTEAQADAWYAAQPWPVGANFLPSTAINELEMWQADTFDPATIDRELGWAEGIGMNTMRVFLHNLLWEQDPKGFEKRIDTFLTIAARHHIRPVFVLVRFLLGSVPETWTAASADSRSAQLGLGAGAGSDGAGRSGTVPEAGKLREGRGGRIRKRQAHSGVGLVE